MCLCLLLGGGLFEKKKFFVWGGGGGCIGFGDGGVSFGVEDDGWGCYVVYVFKMGFDGIAWGGWVMGIGIVQHMFWNGALFWELMVMYWYNI